jgi:putative tricarboxylic transport membrane protein
MRAAFLVAILCVALFYSYHAFTNLAFLSMTGRLGPGFFPRIIGVGLVLACIYALALDWRERVSGDASSHYWPTVLAIAGLSGLFVASLNILGGPLAMFVFLLLCLSLLNRGHPVQNVLISAIFPAAVYLLFRVWLNASMPRGIVPLPL